MVSNFNLGLVLLQCPSEVSVVARILGLWEEGVGWGRVVELWWWVEWGCEGARGAGGLVSSSFQVPPVVVPGDPALHALARGARS